MEPPTIIQLKRLAYIPKPFAFISFLSSGCVAYHLLFQKPEKRKRLYHRLVLAMNLAIMPLSFSYFYGNWAVPAQTPDVIGAVGNVQSCTAFGFINIMMAQTVPIYYGSLALQSFMAIRTSFKEENYVWIEKWIHIVALAIPCAITVVCAATQNINPSGAECWLDQIPSGCASNPEVQCQREQDISWFVDIFGLGQVFLYFVFPPIGVLAIYFYLKKIQRRANNSRASGMQLVRASAQKQVLRNVANQISVYLVFFWFTTVFSVMHVGYQLVTGKTLYNLNIFTTSIYSSQGFVLAVVYFVLEKIGRRSLEVGYVERQRISVTQRISITQVPQLTVANIRQNAEASGRNPPGDEPEEPVTFHIFDGTPDENSPWAKYFSQSGDEGDDFSMGDEFTEEKSPPNIRRRLTNGGNGLDLGG